MNMTEKNTDKTADTIILASSSPRRKEIFEKHGIPCDVIPSGADETIPIDLTPEQTVMYLSLLKAMDVTETLPDGYENALIVASDTIVEKDGEILGKPVDRDDAYSMIKKLSGTGHRVLSGVCAVSMTTGEKICFYDMSDVFFTDIPEDELLEYIDTPEPYDKAGGYAIQETFSKYIERYTGDIENIIGFPFGMFESRMNDLMK